MYVMSRIYYWCLVEGLGFSLSNSQVNFNGVWNFQFVNVEVKLFVLIYEFLNS